MDTSKIIVKDLVPSTLSNADGYQLFIAIDKILASGNNVVLSFHDINTLSSSFLNSSFGNMIDKYGFDVLSKIRIIDYTAILANFIKKYIDDLKSITTN